MHHIKGMVWAPPVSGVQVNSGVKTRDLRYSHSVTALCYLIAFSLFSPFEELMGGWDSSAIVPKSG